MLASRLPQRFPPQILKRSITTMSSTKTTAEKQKIFLSSPQFAVTGSFAPEKFGFKVRRASTSIGISASI